MREYTLDEIREALRFMHYDVRDEWVRCALALKTTFGDIARDIWEEWGSNYAGYNAREAANVWRTAKVGGLTVGSIIHEAKSRGWVPGAPVIETDEQKRQRAERKAQREKEAAAEAALVAQYHEVVAAHAADVWARLGKVGRSQYLGRKRVQAHGVRFGGDSFVSVIDKHSPVAHIIEGMTPVRQFLDSVNSIPKDDRTVSFRHVARGCLVVPLADIHGKLWSLQFIWSGGSKTFFYNGRKSACFHLIGDYSGAGVLAFAEGYATAASVHEATGWPVVVCIDAGNLAPVIAAWREKYQHGDFLVVADDDVKTEGNPGLTAATTAAEKHCCRLFVPKFIDPEGGKLKDANDLHVQAGIDVLREQLLAAPDAVVQSPAPSVELGAPSDVASAPTDSPQPLSMVGRLSLEQVLERFALIFGDTKVWDLHEKRMLKKNAFDALVGKEIAGRWRDHADRRTVMESDVRALMAAAQAARNSGGEGGGIGEALQRYVYLYPTDTAWDAQERDFVQLKNLKYAIADCYEDWIKHPHRRMLNQSAVVFDPTQRADPELTINMFRGLRMVPAGERKHCERIRQLVLHLCNWDDEHAHWMTCWLALPLQRMGTKMASALMVHSDVQGSGKSLLFDVVMREIYGEYGATLGQHQMESQYTDWRSKKLFLLFEEIFSRDQKYSHTGTVKHMISGRTHRIEKKFISGWEEANYGNAVFLSNEMQPFPIEESDRRMFVVWPEKTLPQHDQYALNAELEAGGIAAFYQYLLRYDLGDFGPHTKPLMTPAKERLIDFGRPSWDTFTREWMREALPLPYTSCTLQDLFLAYEKWAQRGRESIMSMTKFSGLVSTRLRRRKDCHYILGSSQYKATLIQVGEPGNVSSQQEWLGECIAKFRDALEAFGREVK